MVLSVIWRCQFIIIAIVKHKKFIFIFMISFESINKIEIKSLSLVIRAHTHKHTQLTNNILNHLSFKLRKSMKQSFYHSTVSSLSISYPGRHPRLLFNVQWLSFLNSWKSIMCSKMPESVDLENGPNGGNNILYFSVCVCVCVRV